MDSWVLTRRFLIQDTVSGIVDPSGYKNGNVDPKYIRWASKIELKVALDSTQTEEIFRPYLALEFSEADVESISSESKGDASLQVEYYSDYSKLLNDSFITLGVLVGLAFVWALVRFYHFTWRNPSDQMLHDYRTVWFKKLTFYVLDICGETMFWLLCLFSVVTLLNYKNQTQAHWMLPELGPASDALNSAFDGTLITCLIFKAVALGMRIYEQANIDIYLIDYERPNVSTKQVNAWRRIFVANEWQELMTDYTYVNPLAVIFWFLFLWIGQGWR